MSFRLATGRLRPSGSKSLLGKPVPSVPCGRIDGANQTRNKWSINVFKGWGKSNSKDANDKGRDPVTSELDDPKRRQEFLRRGMHGGVEDNIFQDEIEASRTSPDVAPPRSTEEKTKTSLAMVADPDPRSRIRWQRKKVIQMVRKNGQLSPEENIRISERQLLHKSEFLPTSVKKLVMLARQIAGRPVDEAIIQMKWSKKKMAAEMKYYLEEARDLAIAHRGMGLGKIKGELFDEPQKIKTKDGHWIEIIDPSQMYVAQSWVGRGTWRGKEIDYKGRGRMGIIQHPSTSFSVLIKEERTRIREHKERVAKKINSGPWVHLPNRRVHGQRPYYSW